MDFGWDEAEALLHDRALAFAREHLNDAATAREHERRFGTDEWRRCGEFGLLGICAPERYGGMGKGALTTAHVLEALGLGCEDTGLLFAASAHLFACVTPIAEYGSDELKARLLPLLCSGQCVGAGAITEAEAGSDVFALKATARRDGNDYVIDGVKSYVTNAPIADAFVVYASTNRAHGYMGLSAFVVEKGTPGLVAGEPIETLGLTTAPLASLYLDGCRVPNTHLLATEGQGGIVFGRSMQWERACLFATYLGATQRLLEQTIEHARQRRQFDKPIGKNQAVSHRIVDMRQRLQAARLLLYRACWLQDAGKDATEATSLAKLAVSEAATQAALDAVRIHGASGVVRGSGIERALRDALPSTIFSGTSEMQRELVARALGL